MHIWWKIAQQLEIRWWQWYLRRRPVGAYLDWKKAYWKQFLERSEVRVEAGSRVLDAGCGPAGIFIALSSAHIEALDPLLDQYESSLRHFNRNWYPEVIFHALPLEQFAPTGTFDCIFCLNAINHVSDIRRSLAVLEDCLSDKGEMILSIDAHRFRMLKWLFRIFKGDALHPHQYGLADYIGMARAKGLELTRVIPYEDGLIFRYYVLKLIKKNEKT